ncbi:uncharacterized protein BT62DRAFT_634592 [Guyanagaster necrorhizus]|uniref:Secreted protein n=1 Tax=Guyanagaster necrorhizus TaxID=856835 RepID=A0A9P7VG16_9AGAR|nr:uncharacterized protein BT62DRAFT_634592 [Guyanagaster necrorhizus MCA 3950]KAG7440281.1 hypothetical protein BT62DRAFT_634592 [Guyanagaster necrorhizus MCA 3950]
MLRMLLVTGILFFECHLSRSWHGFKANRIFGEPKMLGRWRSWLSPLSNTQKVLSWSLDQLMFLAVICNPP